MGLNMRMWLLVALMFGILYGVITGIGAWMGAGNALFYLVLAFFFIGIQYVIGPSLVQLMMRVRWVGERDEPELHQMIGELAQMAGLEYPLGRYVWQKTGRGRILCPHWPRSDASLLCHQPFSCLWFPDPRVLCRPRKCKARKSPSASRDRSLSFGVCLSPTSKRAPGETRA